MKLSEIAVLIERHATFPLVSIRQVPSGVIAELGTVTPDGQDARISVMLSALDCSMVSEMLTDVISRHARDASKKLEEYVQSFQPVKPPTWDEVQWGP